MSDVDDAKQRYEAALHAMQTGVAYYMERSDECSPKHLRVGVNSALTSVGALAHLLLNKGVITELEYFTCLADLVEQDVEDYRRLLAEALGVDQATIKLS